MPARNYVERKGFVLRPKFIFIDGRTGATIYREQYREEILYTAQQNTPALSSYFELMDRLVPELPQRAEQPEDPRHARPLEVGRPFGVGSHYNYPITRLPDYPMPVMSARPLLKWAGGKRWQVPHLRTLWAAHAHRRLVEPFCGGLAVTLGLAPSRALLNDANPHLINFYWWVQKGLVTDIEMANDRALFYRHRDRFNELLASGDAGSRESAALFYYLNRTGFNGLCRFNRRGLFNVPFGALRAHQLRP